MWLFGLLSTSPILNVSQKRVATIDAIVYQVIRNRWANTIQGMGYPYLFTVSVHTERLVKVSLAWIHRLVWFYFDAGL